MEKIIWVVTNIYGKVLGRPLFAPFHRALITLSIHGLGYANMLRESWTGEEWFIKKVLTPTNPKLIFDVGANIGNYSRLLLLHTAAEVHAFEPSTSALRVLNKIESERLKIIKKAVSNHVGKATLNSKFACDGKASLDSRIRKGDSEEVQVTTIADYVKENRIESVDYIKIDTEGFEYEVIEGLGGLRPKFIQFEFNINHLQRRVTVLQISELLPGYEFYRLLPNGWLKFDPAEYVNNIFVFCNIVAVRKN